MSIKGFSAIVPKVTSFNLPIIQNEYSVGKEGKIISNLSHLDETINHLTFHILSEKTCKK